MPPPGLLPPLPQEWTLTPEARLGIFTTSIIPHELTPYIHLNHQSDGVRPLAVIIVGQTGAGKTRLAPVLQSAMTALGRQPAHFIADVYKTYHPFYSECIEKFPASASILAGLDARLWLTMACEYAVAQRLDVLVESACRHPDDFCKLAEVFHRGGYMVKVAILAVPEALSRLGILVRYYRNLPEAQSGKLPLRLTPKKVHDDSYQGLGKAVQWVDEGGEVDQVVVVRRGNLVSYHNEREHMTRGGVKGRRRKWIKEAGATKALETERRRALSQEEKQMALSDIEELRQLKDAKVDAEIVEIEKLITALLGLKKSAFEPYMGFVGQGKEFPALEPLKADEFVAKGVVK
ncbi:zeta toxin-domain-containing protein [Diplogelasinospora grovesii]|uniref:Zeta toxin-domain-containing protein n=1 Tax=Diplogelasinospora grovesii TaxID=303347 RepID=A0AAN6NED6_9PEZI|nr:zeta toxin-domain-containing protein [Diplogelasinospora grovesii]